MSRASPEDPNAAPSDPGAATPGRGNRYDVFISYRRSGGSDLAQLVYAALVSRGYRVFLDVREMPAGAFDQALIRMIAQVKDVVILLTSGCLDHCTQAQDWFREEITRAMGGNTNVVPLKTPDFVFPPAESLPTELQPLLMRHVLSYSHEHSDASLDNLCKLLRSTPRQARNPLVLIGVTVVVLLAASFAAWRHFRPQTRPAPGGSAPTPSVVSSLSTSPRLEVYHLEEGARVPLDRGEGPLASGSELTLVPVGAQGKSLYLLEISGEGHAELYDQQQLEKVRWGWSVDGPPASETLLLLSSDHPLPEAERRQITDSINRLKLVPTVAGQTQVVWSDGSVRTLATSIPGRGPKDVGSSDWQQQVLRVLKSAEGVSFDGVSVPVKAKP